MGSMQGSKRRHWEASGRRLSPTDAENAAGLCPRELAPVAARVSGCKVTGESGGVIAAQHMHAVARSTVIKHRPGGRRERQLMPISRVDDEHAMVSEAEARVVSIYLWPLWAVQCKSHLESLPYQGGRTSSAGMTMPASGPSRHWWPRAASALRRGERAPAPPGAQGTSTAGAIPPAGAPRHA